MMCPLTGGATQAEVDYKDVLKEVFTSHVSTTPEKRQLAIIIAICLKGPMQWASLG
jgi:hypothetical protein